MTIPDVFNVFILEILIWNAIADSYDIRSFIKKLKNWINKLNKNLNPINVFMYKIASKCFLKNF